MSLLVDAAPARAAARFWWDEGWSAAAIGAAADVPPRTIGALLSGTRERIRKEFEDRLLAVTGADLFTLALTYPATASRRRLQHLHLRGWPQSRIAAGTGLSQATISSIAMGGVPTVQKASAHSILGFFVTHRDLDGGDERARRRALAHGWQLLDDVWEHDETRVIREEIAA